MSNIKLFDGKRVRSAWNEAEQQWYFSVQDVVEILTDTVNVKDYIKKLRKRDPQIDANWGTNCPLVEMLAADGRKRKIQAATVKGLFRIIQSIPSPKAEPFKQWLAQIGYERMQEIEDPELATQRARDLYKAKGYPTTGLNDGCAASPSANNSPTNGKNTGSKKPAITPS